MDCIGAGLHADVGHGAGGVAEGGVVGGGIDLELLDEILGRGEGGGAVGHYGGAVDGGFAAVAAGAVDDDAGGDAIIHGVAGGEAGEVEGVAADDGEFLDAALFHDEAPVGAGVIELGRFAGDLDGFGDVAQGEGEVESDAVADAELDVIADGLFEACGFDGNAIDAGD